MSLGHLFSTDKILLSIVFFVGISIVLSMATTGYGSARVIAFESSDVTPENVQEALRFGKAIIGEMLLIELVQSAVLYVATVLGLKKGLNLA